MNGNQHYDYWSAYDAALAEKQRETAEYKKLLFILAISVIAVTVVVQVAALLAYQLLPLFPTHPDWPSSIAGQDTSDSVFSEQDIAYFRMWLANDVIVYVPPLLAFGIIFRNRLNHTKPGDPYKFESVWVLPFFLAGIAIATGSSIFTSVVAGLFSGGSSGEDVLPDIFREVMPQSSTQLLIMFFTVGVIAPICEEIIYRHLLLKPLRRYGDLQAVIITSVLFGFFHGNMTQFLYTTMVGFILGVAAVRANSVTPAIIIHMLNNIYVVFNSHLLVLSERGEISINSASLGAINIAVLVLGVTTLAVMGVKNMLTVENFNQHISQRERAHILARRPSVIALAFFLIFITIIGTIG